MELTFNKNRRNFSDLRDHRSNHNFNCQNPSCVCGLEDETTVHYFLCCPHYCQLRTNYLIRYITEVCFSKMAPGNHRLAPGLHVRFSPPPLQWGFRGTAPGKFWDLWSPKSPWKWHFKPFSKPKLMLLQEAENANF